MAERVRTSFGRFARKPWWYRSLGVFLSRRAGPHGAVEITRIIAGQRLRSPVVSQGRSIASRSDGVPETFATFFTGSPSSGRGALLRTIQPEPHRRGRDFSLSKCHEPTGGQPVVIHVYLFYSQALCQRGCPAAAPLRRKFRKRFTGPTAVGSKFRFSPALPARSVRLIPSCRKHFKIDVVSLVCWCVFSIVVPEAFARGTWDSSRETPSRSGEYN